VDAIPTFNRTERGGTKPACADASADSGRCERTGDAYNRRLPAPCPPDKERAMDALERITKQVTENPVIIYMKGTPEFPQCGFSARTVQALNACGVEYAYVNIFEDEEIYRSLPKFANWPTFPQVYVKGELVGGCDIMLDLFQSGELQKMLKEAVAGKKAA
jgi:monothiol glutaredoxin